MIKVLFVCLGNICRSPMAEYVFKDMVEKREIKNKFLIESAATSSEEVGNGMHYGTKNKLDSVGIKYDEHRARKITPSDYEKYDFILGMEESNIKNIKRIMGQDIDKKIYRLLDFSNNPRDIADPWYTGNFNITYNDICEGCESFLEYLKENFSILIEK